MPAPDTNLHGRWKWAQAAVAAVLASEIHMPEMRTHHETKMEHTPIDRKQANKVAHPEWFTGPVHMQYLTNAERSEELEVIAVFFENGATTVPHVHATDQLLVVVEGRCVAGDLSGSRELAVGETLFIPALEWHWHGAAVGHSGCHLSIRKPGPTNWNMPKPEPQA